MRFVFKLSLSALLLIAILFTACQKDDPLLDSPEDELIEENLIERNCDSEAHMEQLLQDPEYATHHRQKYDLMDLYIATRRADRTCNNPAIIPVAIHIQGISNTNRECLAELAQRQIDVLNADFQGRNDDLSKWTDQATAYFQGVENGEACFEFCIATNNHPSGYGLSNGQPAITINQTSGDYNSSWAGYLNIYIRSGTGVLGYSPVGGRGRGDGVVIEADAFGTGSGCGTVTPNQYWNRGRTLTHEIGHYLLLDHIWGGGCNRDDGVSDTPNASGPNSGCPSLGSQSCGSNDMHMNYMDYTRDQCMYMFSAGQVNRMEAYLNSNLSILLDNASNVCDSTTGGGDTDSGNTDTGAGNGDEGTGGDGSGEEGSGGDEETPSSEQGCATPTISTAKVLTPYTTEINWTEYDEAIQYAIAYKKPGDSWRIRASKTATITLTSLTPDRRYEYRLTSKCASGWQSWSSGFFFTTTVEDTETEGCSGYEAGFRLVLDDYGSETTWELTNSDGVVIDQGGPYQDNMNGTSIRKTFCLDNGCYRLYVDDSYGDGLCCDYGNGYFELLDEDGNAVARSDGRFGRYEVIKFCITSASGFRQSGQDKDVKSSNLLPKASSNSTNN
ncbi:MAG: hypothetical protein KJP00_14135 [Bacteroidia bacterium]|nr:hypothetical protein [Bacteroidia bacterium]